MIVNNWLLGSNPFFEAYIYSDFLGRSIFLALIFLSICTWVVLIYKLRITYGARRSARAFQHAFKTQRQSPLSLDYSTHSSNRLNPFLFLYLTLREQTIDVLNKNRRFAQGATGKETTSPCLSPSDIDLVASHLTTAITVQTNHLESNLYLLSTIVSLGPFLGLLGTVWGILTTFSQLQLQTGGTHQAVLGGLSLALATTVLGLVDAIPALVGYNYLKNTIRDFEVEMETFSTEILSSIELQYRQVDTR